MLVVDDNPAERLAVRAMLAPLGHPVVEADSGRAALRAVLRQNFAVILMDVRMPTLDGYETADADPAAPPVGAHADHLPHRVRPRRDRDGDRVRQRRRRLHLRADRSPTCCGPRCRPSSTCSCRPRSSRARSTSITALNAALRDSEVRARAVLQNVADGIVTAGEGGLIESFNQSARRLFGYREDEVIGEPLELIVAPSHQDDFADPARARWSLLTASDIPAEPTETVGCRKDGSCFPMEMDMSQMQIGERTFTIGCIRDISGRKAYTEALEHRTLHDDLTGLPNRALFGDRMDRAIADAERAGEPRGVLLVDLDELPDDQRDARPRERRRRAQDGRRAARRPPCATPTRSRAWAATSSAILAVRRDRRRDGRGDRLEGPRRVRGAVPDRGRGPQRAREHRDRVLPAARPHDRRPAAPRLAGDAPGQAGRRRRSASSSPSRRIRPRAG